MACEKRFFQRLSTALGRAIILRYFISPLSHRQTDRHFIYTNVVPSAAETISTIDVSMLSEAVIFIDNKATIANELPALLEDVNNWYIAVLPEGFIPSGGEYIKR